MTPDDAYDYITQHMTAEQALRKLLEGSVMQYESLKFNKEREPVHPILIIAMAACDMKWYMSIEDEKDGNSEIHGMLVGTSDYVYKFLK